jgi:pimeloyl-ACP methyl ester carboxylesterase
MTLPVRDPRAAAQLLDVEVRGPAAAPPVMLLHGGNLAGIMWTPQVGLLDDLRLLVPDMPGYGGSHELTWHSVDDTVEVLAAWLRDHVDTVAPSDGGGVHVVGLSLGASVAAILAARHPDLVRSALVAGAPFHGLGPAMRVAVGAQLRAWRVATVGALLARGTRIPNAAMREAVDAGVGVNPASAARIVHQSVRGTPALLPDLDSCAVPLLGVCGALESRVVRDAMLELDRGTDATFALAPGMHHVWNYERPQLFADMIRAWVLEGRVHDGLTRVRPRRPRPRARSPRHLRPRRR